MRIKQFLKKMYYDFPHSDIYMFHHVQLEPPVVMSGCRLDERDFCEFADHHCNAVPVPELLASRIPPVNKVGYTFDDGLEDVYSIAYPYLKKKNIPFTVFILTSKLDTPGYIKTEELIEMSNDPLVTIGAHGTEHRILTQASLDEQEEEIITSKHRLERIIGKEVCIFAYSHGQYNVSVIDIVKKAGYKFAFSVRGRPLNLFELRKRYELPRYNVDRSTIMDYK